MRSKKLSIPYIIWMLVFTMIPLVMIGVTAFTDNSGAFSVEAFVSAFQYTNVFLKSLWIAFLSTVLCLVLAYPLAYMISQMRESSQNLVVMLLMSPMWMNFLLRIYAWVLILQNYGPLDMILNLFGVDITLIGNSGAVIVGMVYEFLPFMILPLHTVMSKIDPSWIEAAQDLGCNGFYIFSKVIFPLSVPGIISGVTMVFVPTASTFLVAQYLGGTQFMIGDVIERVFQSDHHTGSAIAVVLMIVILGFLVFMNRFGDKEAVN